MNLDKIFGKLIQLIQHSLHKHTYVDPTVSMFCILLAFCNTPFCNELFFSLTMFIQGFCYEKGKWTSRITTYLGICTVLLFALATRKQIGLGTSCFGHLVLSDSLFGQIFAHFFQLITCHFLSQTKWQNLVGSSCFKENEVWTIAPMCRISKIHS